MAAFPAPSSFKQAPALRGQVEVGSRFATLASQAVSEVTLTTVGALLLGQVAQGPL